MATQATISCGRFGLLGICLHLTAVLPESFTEFGDFESLKSGDQGGHSLFGGLLLSAQKVRPRPVSKETEMEELDQGERYMLLTNTVQKEID